MRSNNVVNTATEETVLLKQCTEVVKTLNSEIAMFQHRLLYLSNPKKDTKPLRNALKKQRMDMMEMLTKMKTQMKPYLKGRETNDDIFRLFVTFTSLAHLLSKYLVRCYTLATAFPMTPEIGRICAVDEDSNSDSTDLIAHNDQRSASTSYQHFSAFDPLREIELSAIQRDVAEIDELLNDVDDHILKPPQPEEDRMDNALLFSFVNSPWMKRERRRSQQDYFRCCFVTPLYM